MKIIEKVALSLLLPALMMINVYGEETSTATTVESCSTPPTCPPDPATCCKESTKEESTTQETTTTEKTTKEELTTTKETTTKEITTKEITTKETTTKETTTEELGGCSQPPCCPPQGGNPSRCCKNIPPEKLCK